MLDSLRHAGGAVSLQAFAVSLLILVLIALGFQNTVLSLIDRWTSPGIYSHGFLAVGVSIYCLWVKRDTLTHVLSRPHPAGLIATCLFGTGWLLAMLSNVLVVQQFCLVALLNAVALTIYGWQGYRPLMFPLLTLFLVIPIWDPLQLPLRDLSTIVTYYVVQGLGVPVLRDGYYLIVPGGSFFVDNSCSGLGFFLSGLLLAVYFGYVNNLKTAQTVLLVSLALILAIVANWIRIVSIILVGSATQMQHFIVNDHLTFGWIVFAVVLVGFFLIANVLFPYRVAATTNSDDFQQSKISDQQMFRVPRAVVVPLTIAMAFPLLYLLHMNRDVTPFPELAPPSQISGKSRQAASGSQWRPQFKDATSTHMASYIFHDRHLDVFTANYSVQKQGKELIHFANNPYDPTRWTKVDSNAVTNPDRGYRVLALDDSRRRPRLIAYTYVLGNYTTADKRMAKLLDLVNVIRGYRGASLLAVSIEMRDANEIEADARILSEFMHQVASQLGISGLAPG